MKVNDLTQTGRDLQAVTVSSCREWWRTFLPPENVQLAYIMCTPCPGCRTSRTGMFIWTVNIFRVTIVFLGYGFLSSLTPTKLWLLWDIYGTSHNACRQTYQFRHLRCSKPALRIDRVITLLWFIKWLGQLRTVWYIWLVHFGLVWTINKTLTICAAFLCDNKW